ncbi:DUF5615 family PIN-like protein [Sphingomonas sp. BIUV-7]|uniref:DUF5615 family PIN-like protein n=1 Tax=Sphingomonas natans TaxID=3063330 RepID=A0ABT8Y5Y4_9SPHN|nr:DUF5615 family PIN-like protein [Sphingomonas sp. BIUV-7]MDO6413733.1 DUF5615 family PIN-like protein [Sphingomonas sp. BIUV-7]
MHFLIDAQLPPALCPWFEEQGHTAAHVADILGGQCPDRLIAARAAQDRAILVTKDDDFRLRFPPEDYQLLWLRCGNITNRALRLWLDARWITIEARLQEGDRLVEVR